MRLVLALVLSILASAAFGQQGGGQVNGPVPPSGGGVSASGTFTAGDLVVGGPGIAQIQDMTNVSGGVAKMPAALLATKAPSSPPSSVCSTNSYAVAFSCDLTKMNFAVGSNITDSSGSVHTLGQPSTGYQFNPNLSLIYGYYSNASGWNQSTSGNGGRTNGSAIYVKADSFGEGDTTVFVGNVFVSGNCPSGATSFLACAAGGILGGQVLAGKAGVYLQPLGDLNCNDEGFDAACIGAVRHLTRSVNTAALGEVWIGDYLVSNGTSAADVGYSLNGPMNVGLDVSNTSLGTNEAALTMSANQRIYGNATAGGAIANFAPTPGTSYFGYNSTNSGWQFTTASATILTIQSGYVGVVNPGAVNTGDKFGVVGSNGSGNLGMTIDNSGGGTTSQTVLNIGNSTATNEVIVALSGGSFSGGLGANAFSINAKGGMWLEGNGNIGINITATGVLNLPSVVTGTPAASVCMDASNNVIKKTTTGSCV